MKFKNILLENQKSGEKLRSLIENEFVVYEGPLYRGSGQDIEKYKIKEPRKDRIPMDTDQSLQKYMTVINKSFYPLHPPRQESKFASTDFEQVSEYGNPHYIFPSYNSDVVFYERDAFVAYLERASFYFSKAEDSAKTVSEWQTKKIKKYVGENEFKLIDSFRQLTSSLTSSIPDFKFGLKKFDSISQIIEVLERIREKIDLADDLKSTIYNITETLFLIRKYFENGKDKYMKNSNEVIINKKYLIVNIDYLDKSIGKNNLWDRPFT